MAKFRESEQRYLFIRVTIVDLTGREKNAENSVNLTPSDQWKNR